MILEIECMHCLESGSKVIYPIINGNKDSEAKQMILDETLFLYRCPCCGNYQEIRYRCIYVDDKLNYVVACNQDVITSKYPDYQIRIVKDIKELKEKILIKENNLDDRIIEIMKYRIFSTLKSKATYRLLLVNNDRLNFVLVYPDGEIIKAIAFDFNDYMDLKNKYTCILFDEKIVDNKYATKVVGYYL